MNIVSYEPCGYRCLRRDCLDSRMSIYYTHRRIKAGIRNAKEAYVAIIVFNIFNEPVNSIPGVCSLINVLIAFLVPYNRTDILIFTFAHKFSADILENHNIVFPGKHGIDHQITVISVRTAALYVIGSTGHKYGMFH